LKPSDRDGLYLLVTSTGIRYWRTNYHFGGQQRTLSFGCWPETLLGDAREMLLEALRSLAESTARVWAASPSGIASLTGI
jgi:hypothetical protein